MNKTDKILILGSDGLVGKALCELFIEKGNSSIIKHNRQVCNLLNKEDVLNWFGKIKPDYVFIAAAKVGGINAHLNDSDTFKNENLSIQSNIFEAIKRTPPKRTIFFGSNCIFPKRIDRAIKESDLGQGDIESSSEGFAQAKIQGIKDVNKMNLHDQIDIISVVPASLYGGSKFKDPTLSHVISGLITRMLMAKENNDPEFSVWGTGQVLREFLHVKDLAQACYLLMRKKQNLPLLINIGSGEEVSISELAFLIQNKIGYKGNMVFDSSKPDGVKRKLLDSSLMNSFGWKSHISLEDGVEELIDTLS